MPLALISAIRSIEPPTVIRQHTTAEWSNFLRFSSVSARHYPAQFSKNFTDFLSIVLFSPRVFVTCANNGRRLTLRKPNTQTLFSAHVSIYLILIKIETPHLKILLIFLIFLFFNICCCILVVMIEQWIIL